MRVLRPHPRWTSTWLPAAGSPRLRPLSATRPVEPLGRKAGRPAPGAGNCIRVVRGGTAREGSAPRIEPVRGQSGGEWERRHIPNFRSGPANGGKMEGVSDHRRGNGPRGRGKRCLSPAGRVLDCSPSGTRPRTRGEFRSLLKNPPTLPELERLPGSAWGLPMMISEIPSPSKSFSKARNRPKPSSS